MTPERFCQLVEIYGATLSRWPAESRADAEVLMESADRQVRAVVRSARALDAALAMHTVAPPDSGLVSRVLATMPSAGPPFAWRLPSLKGWRWSGVGVLGVGIGGVAAGMIAMSMMLPAGDPTPVDQNAIQANGFGLLEGGTVFDNALDGGKEQ